MPILEIAKKIDSIIRMIYAESSKSNEIVLTRAKAMADYDKALATEILRLRKENIPAAVLTKIAKGNTADLYYQAAAADGLYHAHFQRIQSLGDILKGYQSIYKHLDTTELSANESGE